MFGQPKGRKLPHPPKAKNKLIYGIVVAILMLVALFNARIKSQMIQNLRQSDAEFQVHVIDVGQGDSILVCADGHAMLVDSGEAASGSKVADYLDALGIKELDYAVASHFHADHIGGFAKVIEGRKVGTILEPECPESLIPTSTAFETYLDAVEQSGAAYQTAKPGDTFSLGNAQITVVAPGVMDEENLNNDSLVMRITYKNTSCLLTGDMESSEESWLLEQGTDLQADFLKVAHHGSANGSGEALLSAVKPSFAAISCAKENDYGHPAASTLDRLAQVTNEVYVTADSGTVVYLYDHETGHKWILTEKQEETP